MPKILKKGLLIFCLYAFSLPASSDASDYSALDEFVSKSKELNESVSGTSLILIKDGKMVHEFHTGLADVEKRTLVDSDSVYYFASTTKSLMAFAVLLVEQKKLLSRNSTLNDLFPDTEFLYIDPRQYTVKELLSHTSGLTNEAMTWTFSYTGLHDQTKRAEFLRTLRADEKRPKGRFNYSNLGYNLMTIWFDKNYPYGWQEALEELIFSQLGMNRTTARVSRARAKRWPIVRPYSYKYKNGTEKIYMEKNDKTLYSVGVFSRPGDWAKFLMSLMPVNHETSPFSQSVINESQQKLSTGSNELGYGWGWQHLEVNCQRLLSHTGGFDGTSVQVSYSPETNSGVIIVHNESGLIANELNKHVTDLAYATLCGTIDEADYQKAHAAMEEVATVVKSSKNELSEQRQELNAKTRGKLNIMDLLLGTYVNKDVGELLIIQERGNLVAQWGDLSAPIRIHEGEHRFLVELRPGKFYPMVWKALNKSQVIELNNWIFEKKKVLN